MPTSRDLVIIRTVCRFGALTREQLRQLCFRKQGGVASIQSAGRRLKLLAERGYLDRMRLPTVMGSGPYLYQPGPKAKVALHADESDLVKGRRSRRVRSVAEVKHGLEVVDFYIAMRNGIASGDGTVETWLTEREVHYALPGRGRSLPFTPDAYCLWQLGSDEGAFFLGWDRGTESMTRIGEKLIRYEKYYGLHAYENHLGLYGLRPRLLFVVNDERRSKQFSQWMARHLRDGRWPSLPTILIAIQNDALSRLLDTIWHSPSTDGIVRFTD